MDEMIKLYNYYVGLAEISTEEYREMNLKLADNILAIIKGYSEEV